MSNERYTTTLISKEKIANNTLELHFTKPTDFTFEAGQFIQFFVPGDEPIIRSYSLASTSQDEHLELCVKCLPDGKASNYFQNLTVGETAEFRGPRGRFVCTNDVQAYYFVATGAGLAPIMGMIREELEVKKTGKEIRLLFGVRNEEDVFWADRLEVLKQQHPLFDYQITLSQPKPDGGWSGLRGRVTEHILHHLVSHSFYLCGSAAMVKDVREILLKNGVDAKEVHFEIF